MYNTRKLADPNVARNSRGATVATRKKTTARPALGSPVAVDSGAAVLYEHVG